LKERALQLGGKAPAYQRYGHGEGRLQYAAGPTNWGHGDRGEIDRALDDGLRGGKGIVNRIEELGWGPDLQKKKNLEPI